MNLRSNRRSSALKVRNRRRFRRLHSESLECRRILTLAAIEPLPGSWIAQFDGIAGSATDQRSALEARFAANGIQNVSIGKPLGLPGLFTLNTSAGESLPTIIDSLHSVPGYQYVEADRLIATDSVPNDSAFTNLWGMNNTGQTVNGTVGALDADIDAPEAWDLATGSSSVVVGVIDTGIDFTHPDLKNNIYVNPLEIAGNGIDDDNNGFVDDSRGWDFYNNDNNPTDDNGHGTHVSGTIGAEGNNGTGVAGVNWHVSIMPLKFLGAGGTGPISAAVGAINYATMMRNRGVNIAVTNNSWGASVSDPALDAAIAAQRTAGILFVAAAGNGGSDGYGDNNDYSPNYPSNYSYDNIIAVAALNSQNNLPSFSNYGRTTVDLGAPGVNIYSTVPTFVNSTGYAYFDGTSMAAPHVTGAAALLKSADPTLTYAQIRNAILNNTDFTSSLNNITATSGRLNVRAALGYVLGGARVTSVFPEFNVNDDLIGLYFIFNKEIDAAALSTDDVVSFTSPAGTDLLSSITGVTAPSPTLLHVTFVPQSKVGKYNIILGPGILDLGGRPMDEDVDLLNGEVPDDRFESTVEVAGLKVTSSDPFGNQEAPVSNLTLNFSKPVDASSFTLADILRFTGPGNTNLLSAITAIVPVSSSQFRIEFTPQTSIGTYSLIVGPNILDMGGNLLDQDGDGVPGETTQDQYLTSFSINAPRISSSSPTGVQISPASSITYNFSQPIDAATFTLADIVSFTGPNGTDLLSSISDITVVNSTTYNVNFAAQSAAGTYTMVVGPNIADFGGYALDQDGDGTPGESTQDQYKTTFSIAAPRITSVTPVGFQSSAVSSITYSFNKPITQSTFSLSDVLSFTGPTGTDLRSTITGITLINASKYRLDFAAQKGGGNYKLVIGPNIADLSGNLLDQNGNGILGEDPGDQYTSNFYFQGARVISSALVTSANGSVNGVKYTFSAAMDFTSFRNSIVSSFTGPNGIDLSSTITGFTQINTTTFQVNFASQHLPGLYVMLLGPDVRDLGGSPLDQDSDYIVGEPIDDRYKTTFSFTAPRIIASTPALGATATPTSLLGPISSIL